MNHSYSFKSYSLIILLPVFILLTGCPGDESKAPDSQTGVVNTPSLTTHPSPIDTSLTVFGPWDFKSTNFELTHSEVNFNLGENGPGRYVLKIQNGNYGPFLAAQCLTIADAAMKKQCQYDNLIERTTVEFTRVEKALGSVNGKKIYAGKTITRSQSYFEEPVVLTADNNIKMDVQAFPTANLKMAIGYADDQAPPRSLFSVSALSITASGSVTFNGAYSYDPNGTALTYNWDFGDGVTATGVKVTHAYLTAGTFTARLRVTAANGQSDEFSADIFVKAPNAAPPATNKNPVLKLAITYPDPTNLRKIHVSLASSYDPDGVITSYAINFGDGAKATNSEIDHEYVKDGTYILTTKIIDDVGGSASSTNSLSIAASNDLIPLATVYGTKTYYAIATGTRTVTETFQVPADTVNDIYRLRVLNADGLPHAQQSCTGLTGAASLACSYNNLVDKTYISLNRVTGFSATINGKQITDSSSINSSKYLYDSIVQLQASNTIVLKISGPITSYVQVIIERMRVADRTPPVLTLQSPAPQSDVYANTNPTLQQVVVTSSKPLQSATINGKAATIVGTTKAVADISFATAGANTVQISATDVDGNTAATSANFNLIFDMVPPAITFSLPENTLTNQFNFNIPVTVQDTSRTYTTISINGVDYFTTTAKSFIAPTYLDKEGLNIITIQSYDEAGNLSPVHSIKIVRDTTAPILTFGSLHDGDQVDGFYFDVNCQSNETIVDAKINNQPMTIGADKLSFATSFSVLKEGENIITADATDKAGNVAHATLRLNIFLRPLNQSLIGLYIDEPNNKVIVKGAVGATRANYKVNVSRGFFSSTDIQADENGSFMVSMEPSSEYKVSVYDDRKNETVSYSYLLGADNNVILSGVVRDTDNFPLIKAKVSIVGTSYITETDNNGVFTFSRSVYPTAKVTGDQQLLIDATNVVLSPQATPRQFSKTSVAITIGISQSNILQTPIYLAPTYIDGTGTLVTVAQGGNVTDDHASGVELNIQPGSVSFPSQNTEEIISMQTISANHATIPAPEWAKPKTVVALEPSGTTFNQSVDLKLPNTNGFPPKTDMVILLMNSKTGKWEIGGAASVSDDGLSVQTKPNQGIKHFSLAYATIAGPNIRQIGSQDKPGADIFNGALTSEIDLPSFKSLGSSITPKLIYKSSWAKPTAVITNLFDFSNKKIKVTPKNDSGSFVDNYVVKFLDCSWSALIDTSHGGGDQSINYDDPPRGCSKNFKEYYQYVQYEKTYTDVTSEIQPEKIESYLRTGPLQTQKSTFSNIPHMATVAYGVELINGQGSTDYFESGIYPYQAHYDIYFKELIMGTYSTKYWSQSINATTTSPQSFEQLSPEKVFGQDLIDSIYVQNYRRSPAGTGWRISGASRIVNPKSDKIMIEEAEGGVSSYNLDNTIQTVIDLSQFGANLSNGVGLNSWPNVTVASSDDTNQILNLSYNNSQSILSSSIGTNYSVAGDIKGHDYWNYTNVSCHQVRECVRRDWGWGWNVCVEWGYVTYCDYTPYSACANHGATFDMKAKPVSMLNLGNKVIGVDSTRHAVFEVTNSGARRLLGAHDSESLNFNREYLNGYEFELQAINNFCSTTENLTCANQYSNRWTLPWSNNCGTGEHSYSEFPHSQSDEVVNGMQSLNSPMGIAASPTPDVVAIADYGFHKVRWLNVSTGQTGVIAGNNQASDLGNGGLATDASINHPLGLVYDSQGNLYISNETGYIRKVDTNGYISIVAGDPINGVLSNEADAKSFLFNRPYGLALDETKGYLYVADSGNNRIVRVDLNKNLASTVAGTGVAGFSGDGQSALGASLNNPTQISLDVNKNLIVADTGNNRIRRIVFQNSVNGVLAYQPTNKDNSILQRQNDDSWQRLYRDGSKVIYNSDGYQTQVIDTVGNSVQFSYDSQNRLTSIQAPTGDVITYNYSGQKLNSIVDPAGRTTSFVYDWAGNLSSVNYPDGSRKSFDYDVNGLMTGETNQRNNKQTYVYNDYNRLAEVTMPDNTKITVNDSGSANLNNFNSNQAVTPKKFGTDANSLSDQLTDAKGSTTVIAKDFQGYISTIVDAKGNKTEIQRDIDGRPIKIISPDNSIQSMTYDPTTGDLLSSTDDTLAITESTTYNSKGQVLTKTDGRGSVITNTYNAQGLLINETHSSGMQTNYTYFANGLVQTKSSGSVGNFLTTTYEYDSKGNKTKVTAPDGKITKYVYDSAGNMVQAISQVNASSQSITSYEYDTFNRLTKVTSPKSEITSYAYLATGELSTITDPKGKITTFEYNQKGQLTKKTTALGQVYQFAYDANGNTVQEIDPKGQAKNYSYDELNRMIQANLPDDVIQYQYNIKGEVVQVQNNSSLVAYARDSKNRITGAQTSGLNQMANYPAVPFNYVYDGNGNRTQLNSSVASLSYSYDDLNRLTGLSNNRGDVFSFGYDSLSRLVSITRPGSVTNYSYTGSGVIDSIIHSSNGTTKSYAQYAYDQRNFPTQKRNIAGTFDYSYDTNGQLTGVSGAAAESFNYDPLGNRLTDTNGNYVYDQASQRLLEDWQYSYSYDDNGNLTTKLPKDLNKNAFIYSYSSKNQLIQVRILEKPLGQVIKQIDYAYDVLGRRMQKSVTDSLDSTKSYSRKYVYDGDNIIVEFDGANNILAQYTHSPLAADDILSASISSAGVTAGLSQSAGNIYYMKDALGSVTDVADGSGNIIQRYNYSSFGKIDSIKDGFGNDITSSPLVSTSFTYTGRELESEVGMYYYRARYYDSNIGRFIQEDSEPGKTNNPITFTTKYSYASNNPIVYVDPSGKLFWFVVAIATIVGGVNGSIVAGQSGLALGSSQWWAAFGAGFTGGFLGTFSSAYLGPAGFGWTSGFWANVIGNAFGTMATNALNQSAFGNGDFNWLSLGAAGFTGAVAGGVGYGVASSTVDKWIMPFQEPVVGNSLVTNMNKGYDWAGTILNPFITYIPGSVSPSGIADDYCSTHPTVCEAGVR